VSLDRNDAGAVLHAEPEIEEMNVCAAQSGCYRLFLASALGLSGDIEDAKTTPAAAAKLSMKANSMAKLLSSTISVTWVLQNSLL
jgi:hypothetical protein